MRAHAPATARPALLAAALLGAAACHDQPTRPSEGRAAPRLAIADAARGGAAGFYWLTPTVPTAPATFPGTFDAGALPALAVEVCPLNAAGDACAGAPVARYTAITTPGAQQLRVDTVRQHYVVYWNTAVSAGPAVTAGQRYRARVLRAEASASRELGFTDVQVVATSGELSGVDRTRFAAVVRGQQLTLRFRVETAPPSDGEAVPATVVREVAERLVATVAAGDSAAIAQEVADILGAFVPLFPSTQADAALAHMASGSPAAFDFQVGLIARALRDGSRTGVDNFLAAASAAGASASGGGPVTRATLTPVLAPLPTRSSYAIGEVLPATVLAISRARAAALAGADPVWGDGQLDALQTTLLMYAVHLAGDDTGPVAARVATSVATTARPLASRSATMAGLKLPSFVSPGRMILNYKTGVIGQQIGMPLTWFQAVPASVCASVLMHSYRFQVEASPTRVGRRGLDLPTVSDAVARLTFDFTPNAAGARILAGIRCELPPNGAAAGKGVQWSLRGALPAHGALESQSAMTDAAGQARARYATIEEVVPEAMRALATEATGTLDVRATGLVPGWSSLEKSVGAGVLNPTDAGVRLSVKHYEWPQALQLEFTASFQGRVMSPTSMWDVGQTASFRLTRRDHGTVMEYYGEGPAAYTHFRPTGTINDCGIEATHTVSGRLGFGLVAFTSGAASGPLGMIDVVQPMSIEHINAHCPPPAPGPIATSVGGYGLLASAVYGPVEPGPLQILSKNPVSGWTVVRPGVLRGVQNRTVQTVIGAVQEQSTFTITLIP